MSKPITFVKVFVCDDAEEIEEKINEYTETEGNLEIISTSVCHTDVFVATVVFERVRVFDYDQIHG